MSVSLMARAKWWKLAMGDMGERSSRADRLDISKLSTGCYAC